MAKTDQELAQEELARQGIDYKYGGDTIMGAFIPERRRIISPETNQVVGYDDRGRVLVETVPARYGESEFDFSYTPVVRGAKAAGSFLRDVFFGDANDQAQAIGKATSAIRGIAESVPQMVTEQVDAAAAGGAIYNPETGRLTEFDPTLVMVGGAPAGLNAALNAPKGSVILGTTLRSGSRAGTGVAAGSAIRETFRIGDEGFDPRFDNRAKEQQRILDTELRYEGSPIIRPEVSIYDLEGKPFALTMADRTKAGSKLTGVEGVDYDVPVDLQGGQDYMFANPLGREGQVWAQDKGATSMYLNSFMGLGGQPLADEIIMLPYRMAPTGGDFATMTAETMLTHARNNMTKKSKAKVDKALKDIYPAWKGVDNPESLDQIAMMKGDPRKQILQVMDRDFRNEGGIGIGQARLAVTDRMQYNAPDYTLQNVGAADPYMGRFEQSGHRTYSQGLAGRPVGTLRETDINAMELLPDFVRGRGFGSVDELLAADPETLAKEYYTMRRGLRGGVITEDMLRDIERRRAQ